ncbi:LuxR family transcriptional regulator [Actinoplanes sp. DH11]|uniref:helix-turn-helix transcriptional regulator n=1 Tax=Actinoplanes sp. DH11 TaxID=2857011 RepID=UPI001E2E9098|nr:LuxR family transcriptional regulator [Actinoplanes sp. DH11]
MTGNGTALVGRERELAHLTAVVDAVDRGPVSLFVCGDTGIGKSSLLDAVTAHARRRGFRVRVLGGATNRPFGLWQSLTGPGGVDPAGLPPHLRRSLAALREPHPGASVDETALVTALLLALEHLGTDAPALIVADDIHEADRLSLWLLTEISRHLSTERVVLLSAAPDHAVPSEFTADLPRYRLRPLSEDGAARLLDSWAVPMTARQRRDVLRRGAGNPLALRLFSDAAALPPAAAAPVLALPPITRSLLLHAALADEAEHVDTLTAAAGAAGDLSDWAPAERAGLIAIRNGTVRFRSPLTRVACAAGRTPGDVPAAHRRLAAVTPDPYRRAHHLAEISAEPDEALAATLEAATRGAADFATATVLQSAAERSPDDEHAARRYARAVFAAWCSGEPEWTIELYEKATAATSDADTAAIAACGAGFALMQSARPWQAFDITRRAVRRRPRDEQIALLAICISAGAALSTGVPAHREQLPGLLDLVRPGRPAAPLAGRRPMVDPAAARAAVLAISDPARYATPASPVHPIGAVRAEPLQLTASGTLAFMRDDSARAATDLYSAWSAGSRAGSPGIAMTPLHLLVVAMIDCGRWADVDRLLDEADQLAAVRRVPLLETVVPVLRATIRALRHDQHAPRPAGIPTLPGTTFVDTLTGRAAGLGALAAGDHEQAYAHFRQIFDEDGEPRHYFLGPRSLPQLALTAARTGHAAEARRILQRCRQAVGPVPTARMAMLLAHSAALLDGTPGAENHFRQAVGNPAGTLHWPLEFAEAQLNYGLWLRGRHRVHEARPHLLAARDVFLRLGARAHADQSQRSLPVGLLPAGEPAPRTGKFADLSAQKQMIARMAVSGLSNRQIAERLFLSPRTVGSHLYRIYAELGVGNRHQLRALIDDTTATLPIGA